MDEHAPFTIEQFYKNICQRKLLGAKCLKCGKVHVPPRIICDNCFSKEFDWVVIPTRGKLLSYTIIHIAPPQFQSMAPYALGIVELGKGMRLPGIIQGTALEQVRVGMDLAIEFGTTAGTQPWPQWPKYYFKPVQTK